MEYPNKGMLFFVDEKRSEKAPDMNGYIKIERDYLKELMDKGEPLVEIKLSAWKKVFASGKKGISVSIDTYVKKDQPAVSTTEKDPWA
jgi:hypothetical protein